MPKYLRASDAIRVGAMTVEPMRGQFFCIPMAGTVRACAIGAGVVGAFGRPSLDLVTRFLNEYPVLRMVPPAHLAVEDSTLR